ncbi:MAG: GrpB family protein [Trebonia sp.]
MGAVVISDADPRWAREYETVAERVRMVLGATLTRVDHIGSTSVPGLAAKDILDVQATVGEEALLGRAFDELTSVGWQARPPRRDHPVPAMPEDAGQWVKRLVYEPAGERRVNLHIRVDGRANQRYALLFRDYLRAHPATATAYGQFKRLAAELPFGGIGEYADLKDPVCDLVYLPAEEWAARTGWVPASWPDDRGGDLPADPQCR